MLSFRDHLCCHLEIILEVILEDHFGVHVAAHFGTHVGGHVGAHFGAFGGGLEGSGGSWGGPGVLGGLLGSMWGVTWLQERVSPIFGTRRGGHRDPFGAQVGGMLRPSWDILGSSWGLSGHFEAFEVELQVRRLLASIFYRFWVRCWVGRRQQNSVNNGPESTSAILT